MNEGMKKDVEKLLQADFLSDPAHKSALRNCLFEETAVLSMDDLSDVTGGMMTELPKFEFWQDEEV